MLLIAFRGDVLMMSECRRDVIYHLLLFNQGASFYTHTHTRLDRKNPFRSELFRIRIEIKLRVNMAAMVFKRAH